MCYLLLAIVLLAAPLGAFALTWDFDEGTTYGWAAKESFLGGRDSANTTTVYSEVADGIWRIAPVPGAQGPGIQLRSPLIGEDSALFDRVTLRLRIVHHRPTEGRIRLQWSNAEKKRLRELGQLLMFGPFSTGGPQLYTTEWKNITIDIRAVLEADPERESTWQGTLFGFQIDLNLNDDARDPDDHPAFLEVDWIQLTGVEELLLGELQPWDAVEAGSPGALFAEPRFSFLGQTIGATELPANSRGALGDVDGDGDADLVVAWERYKTSIAGETVTTVTRTLQMGWTVAANDGLGGFIPTREVQHQNLVQVQDLEDEDDELIPFGYSPIYLRGGDFDGDGFMDLVFNEGRNIELWHNRGEDGFETILQLFDVGFVGLADGEGDGDVDLLVNELDDESSHVILWINDGDDGFIRSDKFVLDSRVELFAWMPSGQPLGEAVRLLWNRSCYQASVPWQLTRPWAVSEEPPIFFEEEINPCSVHLMTDFDGDGRVEFFSSPEWNLLGDPGVTYHGLDLWHLDASGTLAHHNLLGLQVLLPHRAIAHDLTGDGLLDLALVDDNLATGPALVVLVGQRNGMPVLEGRYPPSGHGRPSVRQRRKRRRRHRSDRAGEKC